MQEPSSDASREAMQAARWQRPFAAALVYLLVGALWIVVSDRALEALAGPEQALLYQTWKGWLYVTLTAVLAFLLVRRLQTSERARLAGELRAGAEMRRASQLAAVAFETHEAMIISDASGSILRVNRAFETLTGYTQAEVLGRNPSLLASGRHDLGFYSALWEALQSDGQWEGEILDRARDGSLLPVWETITAVRDERGQVVHYVATLTDLRESKRARQAIERLSRFDALTGLPNRQTLLDALERELAELDATRVSAVLHIDLDNFRQVNEAAGQVSGDVLLREVAARLDDDLDGRDVLARHAADEFLWLHACRAATPQQAAHAAGRRAERIRHLLAQPFSVDGGDVRLTASIGIALAGHETASAVDILRSVETAMHQAKREGPDAVRMFDPAMRRHAEQAFRLAGELRQALDKGAFELHYQVKVDDRESVVGAEALLRWTRADGVAVSPAEFIPVAEASGLMPALGAWVLARACADLAELASRGRRLPLAVNVSATQLRDPRFLERVRETVEATGAEPRDLTLEITESVVIGDVDTAIARLTALRELGLRLSMDDFGTGYSSLAYLKRLPLDEVKIDRSFVSDAVDSESARVLIEAVAAVGRALGLSVVAEGVETDAQAALLRAAGVDVMQGWLFGRPLPMAQIDGPTAKPSRLN